MRVRNAGSAAPITEFRMASRLIESAACPESEFIVRQRIYLRVARLLYGVVFSLVSAVKRDFAVNAS